MNQREALSDILTCPPKLSKKMPSKREVEEAALLGNKTKRERPKKIWVKDKVQNLGSSNPVWDFEVSLASSSSPFLKDKLDDVYNFYLMCFSNYMPSNNSQKDKDNSFPFKVIFLTPWFKFQLTLQRFNVQRSTVISWN